MSYCLSINTYEGLVLCASSFISDLPEKSPNSQPNKLLDHSNMQRFIWPGNRFISVLSSGNQLTIDGVLSKIQQDLNKQTPLNLLSASSLDEVSDYIADLSVKRQHELIEKHGDAEAYKANFIVSGQINHHKMETLLVYAEGNYIHESNESPFLQIGEMKFGKPILDRMIKRNLDLNRAAHCALVSVDSTTQSNPSRKIKTELLIYKNNGLTISHHLMLDENSDFFTNMSNAWNDGITAAIDDLPPFHWE